MDTQHLPAQPIDAYCAGIPALGATFTLAWLGFGVWHLLLGVVLAGVSGLAISEFALHWKDNH
jgi:amino acid permease